MNTYPPNTALAAFAPFLGEWTTVGSHGMIPNTTLHGRTRFALHESGAFIVVQTSIQEDVGIPEGLALIGSDDTLAAYVMIYYDERGVSRHYEVSIEERTLKWWRKAPEFSQRTTLTLSADGQAIAGVGEISKDDETWEPDLSLTYSKC